MSIENIRLRSADCKAVQVLEQFFDPSTFTEINAVYGDSMAEVVCGYGYVDGMQVCAFCQDVSESDGAMSVAQAKKLEALYSLALKTGNPIVGFYSSKGARLAQGNALLDALSAVLSLSSKLSGVVPQISVVLDDCIGSTALLAANADFVVKTEKAKIALDPNGDACSCCALCEKDEAEAINSARALITYLPSNNLSAFPVAMDVALSDAQGVDAYFDANSVLELKGSDSVSLKFARIEGNVVGVVETKGGTVDKQGVKKLTSFVRFLDAFSIPVVTFADTEGFCCVGGAKKVLSAYAEATTTKITVINGKATGVGFLAFAGGNADATVAIKGAVVSPIKPEAAAYIMLGDKLSVPVAEQDKLIKEYISTELSAENAAVNGYINDVSDEVELRARLSSLLEILSSKRETTLPKKHTTV